jgi:hypothetical protein
VEATLACLVAPEKRPDFLEYSHRAYYALDLTDAQIDGTLHLRPDFRARGGVSVALARIAGDVLANGAEMIAVEGDAFYAQTAAIRGNLMLRAVDFLDKDSVPFRAEGGVWLSGARIEGTLEMSGARLTGNVVAEHLHLGETAQLRAWCGKQGGRPALLPFVAGDVGLSNARIGGELDMSGAQLKSLSAEDVTVGSNVQLGPSDEDFDTASFAAAGAVSFAGAKITGGLSMEGASVESLTFDAAQVGGDVSMDVWRSEQGGVPRGARCSVSSAVSMSGVKIGGNLSMAGARLGELDAENAHIQGDVQLCAEAHDRLHVQSFRFTCEGQVSFRGAAIQGLLDCGGAQITTLTAEGATIGRTARFSTATCQVDGQAREQPFEASNTLSLFEANIKGTLTLDGAQLGELMAINVAVGGSLDMRAAAREGDAYWRFDSEIVKLVGARIGHDLRLDGARLGELDASDAMIGGDVNLRAVPDAPGVQLSADSVSLWDSQIGHGLRIHDAEIGEVNAIGAKISGPLHVRGLRYRSPAAKPGNAEPPPMPLLRFNLTDASAGTLDDQEGRGFGTEALLVLDGFKFARIEDKNNGDDDAEPSANGQYSFVWRALRGSLLRLDALPRWARATAFWASIAGVLAAVLAPLPSVPHLRLPLFLIAAACLALGRLVVWGRPGHGWRARLTWLNLQYPDRSPALAYFRPGAYDQLAQSFRMAGADEDARNIVSERLRLERQLTERGLIYPFRWLFDVLFMHGLSPVRALVVFIVGIMIGIGGVTVADQGSTRAIEAIPLLSEALNRLNIPTPHIDPVLMVETRTVNSSFIPAGKTRRPALLPGGVDTPEMPCGDLIDPRLYAIELFVPALDLHQEERCSVASSADASWWRVGMALYRAVGWLITSLTILTMSGILRRHVED